MVSVQGFSFSEKKILGTEQKTKSRYAVAETILYIMTFFFFFNRNPCSSYKFSMFFLVMQQPRKTTNFP